MSLKRMSQALLDAYPSYVALTLHSIRELEDLKKFIDMVIEQKQEDEKHKQALIAPPAPGTEDGT